MDGPLYDGPVTVAIEWISPTEAADWLSRNVMNRKPKTLEIATLARDIEAGLFDLNGETIKFDRLGNLLDGQNRLMAVVEADRGIWSVVVRGLPAEAQDTTDIGVKRSLGDVLHLAGHANATNLAAAIQVAWRLDFNGHLHYGEGIPAPSVEEALMYLGAHPSLPESVRRMEALRQGVLRYPTSVSAGLFEIMARHDGEAADHFWTSLEDGLGLPVHHPIHTLRAYLLRDLSNRRRMDRKFRAAITIKAWNAFRSGKPVVQLYWRRFGDKPEPFPVIQ